MQKKEGVYVDGEYSEYLRMCLDSGASAVIWSSEDEYLCDFIVEEAPDIGVIVADGHRLQVSKIGTVNSSSKTITVVADGFYPDAAGNKPAKCAPRLKRILLTKGIKKGTRLGGVNSLRDKPSLRPPVSACAHLCEKAPGGDGGCRSGRNG